VRIFAAQRENQLRGQQNSNMKAAVRIPPKCPGSQYGRATRPDVPRDKWTVQYGPSSLMKIPHRDETLGASPV